MNKKYIIVGDNNFWYSILDNKSEIKDEIEDIKNIAREGNQTAPMMLYVFEAREIDRITLGK